MRLELFPTIVHHEKLAAHARIAERCRPVLDELFSRCERSSIQHPLELGSSVTTFPIERALFRHSVFSELVQETIGLVVRRTGLWSEITEMWANRHKRDSVTLEHLHGAQICGAYYLDCPPNSGRLGFRIPLEYALCGSMQVDTVDLGSGDSSLHYLPIESGDIVLFPGWLKHLTEPCGSDEPRVVISFNMRVLGLADN